MSDAAAWKPGQDTQAVATARLQGQDPDKIHCHVWGVVGNLGDSICYAGVPAKVEAIQAELRRRVAAADLPVRVIAPNYASGISDGQRNGTAQMRYSLIGRETTNDGVCLHLEGSDVRGVIAVVACDKPPVGTLAAILEHNVPAVIMSDGSIRPGIDSRTGEPIDIISCFQAAADPPAERRRIARAVEVAHDVGAQQRDRVSARELVPQALEPQRRLLVTLPPQQVHHLAVAGNPLTGPIVTRVGYLAVAAENSPVDSSPVYAVRTDLTGQPQLIGSTVGGAVIPGADPDGVWLQSSATAMEVNGTGTVLHAAVNIGANRTLVGATERVLVTSGVNIARPDSDLEVVPLQGPSQGHASLVAPRPLLRLGRRTRRTGRLDSPALCVSLPARRPGHRTHGGGQNPALSGHSLPARQRPHLEIDEASRSG